MKHAFQLERGIHSACYARRGNSRNSFRAPGEVKRTGQMPVPLQTALTLMNRSRYRQSRKANRQKLQNFNFGGFHCSPILPRLANDVDVVLDVSSIPLLMSQQTPCCLNILHLEDDSFHSELLCTELEIRRFSYSIARVWTRDSFNAALQNGLIDIIVADWKTEGALDSATALGDARRHGSDAPFVFFAQDFSTLARVEAFRRGATDFISKADLPKLVRVLSQALHLKQGRIKPSISISESESDDVWKKK